jgi:hypothetical protein
MKKIALMLFFVVIAGIAGAAGLNYSGNWLVYPGILTFFILGLLISRLRPVK